jgi:hypothetical protein
MTRLEIIAAIATRRVAMLRPVKGPRAARPPRIYKARPYKPRTKPSTWKPGPGCCRCGRPRDGAKARCAECRASEGKQRDARIAAGICYQAWSHGPAAPGGTSCATCREFYRVQMAVRKAAKREASKALELTSAA